MEHGLTAPSPALRDLVASVGGQVETGERIMQVEAGAEQQTAPKPPTAWASGRSACFRRHFVSAG